MKKTILQAHNINYVNNQQVILDKINLSVYENDFLVIIGPNGAGKSTLIKILIKTKAATSGQVEHDKSVRMSYVPQKLHLSPYLHLSTQEFLCLSSNYQNLETVLDITEISELLPKSLNTLSSGELQQVIISYALMSEPNLLIMDEPTNSMDLKTEQRFHQIFQRLHREKKISIVLVSHNIHLVLKNAKHIICLFNKILCSGTPNTVIAHKKFSEHQFFDDFNLTSYNHSH